MLVQRKKVLYPRPPRLPNGVEFPVASTSEYGRGAMAASLQGVDDEASASVAKERNWRFGYARHFVKNVIVCARSRKACLQVARQGLVLAVHVACVQHTLSSAALTARVADFSISTRRFILFVVIRR